MLWNSIVRSCLLGKRFFEQQSGCWSWFRHPQRATQMLWPNVRPPHLCLCLTPGCCCCFANRCADLLRAADVTRYIREIVAYFVISTYLTFSTLKTGVWQCLSYLVYNMTSSASYGTPQQIWTTRSGHTSTMSHQQSVAGRWALLDLTRACWRQIRGLRRNTCPNLTTTRKSPRDLQITWNSRTRCLGLRKSSRKRSRPFHLSEWNRTSSPLASSRLKSSWKTDISKILSQTKSYTCRPWSTLCKKTLVATCLPSPPGCTKTDICLDQQQRSLTNGSKCAQLLTLCFDTLPFPMN